MTRSIIGFHYGPGGDKQGIGDYMRKLNDHGIPFLVKGADDAGICFEGQEVGKEKGVENWLIYRLSTAGQGRSYEYDVPDYLKSPLEAAQEHWEETVAKWPPELDKSIVWMEPINEPRAKASSEDVQWSNLHPTDWLGKFMLEYAKIANAAGFKVCGPSFNSGEPEVFSTNDYELPGMLAYMKYCAEHPDQAALSIHEYVWDSYKHGADWQTWYPNLFGRVEAAFAAADKHKISRDFKIFVTEWGFAYRGSPRWPECEPYLTAYNEWAARWPQVKGVAAWTLQTGWGNVDKDVVSWIKPLSDYTINRTFDSGQQPSAAHELFDSSLPGQDGGPAGGLITHEVVGEPAAEAGGFSASIDLGAVALTPNTTFEATWIFLNSGTAIWDSRTQLVYTDENHPETAGFPRAHFATATAFPITEIGAPSEVRPGERVSLTLKLTAPHQAGLFGSNWQLLGPDGKSFGPIRWVRATVEAGQHDVQFVAFTHSILNYEQLAPGQSFTGTWRLINSGSAPWTSACRLVYTAEVHSETADRTAIQMCDKASYSLNELSGQDRVNPGEEVTINYPFQAPDQAGKFAFQWQFHDERGRPFGGLRWMKVGVVGEADLPEDKSTKVRFGMNVNINDGHALDAERLAGLSWVRFVFWASRLKKSPQKAYEDRYRSVIKTYASQGIRSLLVLHQDTEWANGPWINNSGWEAYASSFAGACADVARACAEFGDQVAYQIFNETDSGFGNDAGNENISAIGIAPDKYALILDAAARAIRQVNPEATIVMGGMKTGPDNAIEYIRRVRQALGGQLPVDAIAYHPYGRFVEFDPFYNGHFGTIQDAFGRFKAAFPDLPLWISELGVADNNPIGPEHYEKIARYMREVTHEVATNHADLVPVLIWFAWSDLMRNAGITTISGELKPHIGDAFKEMVTLGK